MTLTVEIDSFWVRFVRSPAFYVVSALSGVGVSFAPYFLYLSGQGKFYHGYERFIVPLCFAVCLVPIVYIRIGSAVIKELRRNETVVPPPLDRKGRVRLAIQWGAIVLVAIGLWLYVRN
jgi:hypothetical protein